MLCFSLLGISFPTFAVKSCSYPSRPCSSATRSLKLFLLSFPSAINNPIFSAPQHFTPILLYHWHCLPVRFGCLSDFATQPRLPWAGGLYLTQFQVFLSQYCKFSRLLLEVGWMVDSVIEVFLRLYFEVGPACVVSLGELPGIIWSLVLGCAPDAVGKEILAVITKAHLSHLSP